MMNRDAAAWLEWDRQYIWHPYTQMALAPNAVGVDRASGSYLFLSDGRKVFDSISSWWVTLHGHAHPVIASAIAQQAHTMEQVIFAGFTHEPASRLAKALVEVTPSGLSKVFFSDNGSTAVEVALKMCLQYWQLQREKRTTFLQIEHGYHGDTFGAMSVSADGVFTAPFRDLLFTVKRLPFPTPPENGTGDLSSEEINFLDQLNRSCAEEGIAAMIYEPLLLGAGGMLTWRTEVLERMLGILQQHEVFAIADEVFTGFGRTGSMFASERCTLQPDIMVLSKGLTGGFMPMGATLVMQKIFDAFLSNDRLHTFFHGHSYTGNPLSCAAGLASLSLFESGSTLHSIREIEQVHHVKGKQLAERHGQRMRLLGTMAAFEPTRPEGYLSQFSLRLSTRALDQGLFVRPLGDVTYFLPPYSTTAEDLHHAYEVLSACLDSAF